MTDLYMKNSICMEPEKICEECGKYFFGPAQTTAKWEDGECDRCEIEGPITDLSNFIEA
jgi:hypothetical protein